VGDVYIVNLDEDPMEETLQLIEHLVSITSKTGN
jgi:hypothetical protein